MDNLNKVKRLKEEAKRFQEKEKYIVDCVSDGETAMFYALNTEYAYDLAIIDRMLPVIDGLTIIKAMRKKGIRIPDTGRERPQTCQLCRRPTAGAKNRLCLFFHVQNESIFFQILSAI